MKKHARPLAVCVLLWVLGIGMSLMFDGCTKGEETNIGSKESVPMETSNTPGLSPDSTTTTPLPSDTAPTQEPANTTDTPTKSPDYNFEPDITLTPEPVSPTPIPVNTDTTTITYLVNRNHPLPEDFVPEGLTAPDVLFPFADTSIDKAKMTPEAGEALALLFDAAYDEAKLTLYGVSAYRSFARQYTIYATNLATRGIAHTNRYSAAPGRSEHQTGLAIDISCASEGFGLETTFADTPEGIWVAENAHRFGFILRYPKDKEHITGYNYEPWHIRYVGTELAAYLFETGLTLDEYYGVPDTFTSDYLETTPLIDTTAESYLSIYRQYH